MAQDAHRVPELSRRSRRDSRLRRRGRSPPPRAPGRRAPQHAHR